MIVRVTFTFAAFVFAVGIALHLLPPALPDGEASNVVGLSDVSAPIGILRPVPFATDASMAAIMDVEALSSAADAPRLVGVTAGREALSHFEFEGGIATASVGDDVGPWRVRAIDSEGVTVEGAEGMIRLRVYRSEAGLERDE